MRTIAFLFAAAGLTAAGIAIAQPPAAAPDGQPPAPAEKKICRQGVPTGSIIPAKRVCRTAAEWAEIDAQNAQRSPASGLSRDGNGRY